MLALLRQAAAALALTAAPWQQQVLRMAAGAGQPAGQPAAAAAVER